MKFIYYLLALILCLSWSFINDAGNNRSFQSPFAITDTLVNASLDAVNPFKVLHSCVDCNHDSHAISKHSYVDQLAKRQYKPTNIKILGGDEVGKADLYLLTKFTGEEDDPPFRTNITPNAILPPIPKIAGLYAFLDSRERKFALLL